jgi:hypothetical protein
MRFDCECEDEKHKDTSTVVLLVLIVYCSLCHEGLRLGCTSMDPPMVVPIAGASSGEGPAPIRPAGANN